MSAFTIPTVFTAIDKLSAPVRAMERNMAGFASKAQTGVARMERGYRKFTPVLSETSKQFLSFASTAAIAAGVVSGIAFSFQSLKDYEKGLDSLSAITGVAGKQFESFKLQVNDVAKSTNKSAVEVAKAFEVVGSAKSDLLESADALGQVTRATITLSKASGDDLETSAKSLTSVMNQFSLGAEEAERTINVLAAGSKVGAANITNVAESMKNFGSVASGANISVEESVALVETLGKFGLFGAEAGTKLRGATLKLQQANVGYASGQFNINDALLEAKGRIDNLATAQQKDAAILKMFGAENITAGKILLENIDLFQKYTAGVTGTSTAQEQAAINTDNLATVFEELKAAWVNLITSNNQLNSGLSVLKEVMKFVRDNMAEIVTVGLSVVGFFAVWKALILTTKGFLIAYNVVLGFSAGLHGGMTKAIASNTFALGAYKVATGIATAATWAWGAALSVGLWPLTLIIVAIAALIPLVQSFRRNWDMIVQAFRTEGILSGLKAIGKTILDSVLMPLQQLLEVAAKVTGFDWASEAAASIGKFRAEMGVNVGGEVPENPTPLVNPEAERQRNFVESVQRQNVSIGIRDETGRATVDSDNDFVPVNLTSTVGF